MSKKYINFKHSTKLEHCFEYFETTCEFSCRQTGFKVLNEKLN